jgi:hypothetical protein
MSRLQLILCGLLALTACSSVDGKPDDAAVSYRLNREPEERSTVKGLKVAFFGDQSLRPAAHEVLQLVVDEAADALIVLGDLVYGDESAADWDAHMREVLGDEIPYFSVIGNHDVTRWFGENGYAVLLNERLSQSDARCEGEYGVQSSCLFRGLRFVMSGVGTYGAEHEAYLDTALQNSDAIFRLCLWHKNQHDMQLGEKTDEVGWEAYRICARYGAPVITAHEHSYARTQLLTAIGDRAQMHGATGQMSSFELGPDRTFVVVSGLGGEGPRARSADHAEDGWWASTYALHEQQMNGAQLGSDPQIDAGALFVTFHVDGDPYKARAYFKTVSRAIYDEFTWRAPP